MNWKQSLDRYLTTPPDDGFDGWAEDALNSLSNDFYALNEDWIDEYNGQCNRWLNKLFDKGIEPIRAAAIIERAFNSGKRIINTTQ